MKFRKGQVFSWKQKVRYKITGFWMLGMKVWQIEMQNLESLKAGIMTIEELEEKVKQGVFKKL